MGLTRKERAALRAKVWDRALHLMPDPKRYHAAAERREKRRVKEAAVELFVRSAAVIRKEAR